MTRLAIASGKGGTGKTTIAVNLALALAEDGLPAQYLDCDVEEPNGHLFLGPAIRRSREVAIPVPAVDEAKCTGCRACAEACQFHAIVVMAKPLIFHELCHGCGGCALACPTGAITERGRPIGVVESGRAGPLAFAQGRLNVGEAMAPPVIRAVKRQARGGTFAIMDAPPGTSCPMVTTVRDADYVLLVTEPTPFGLCDLRLAIEVVRSLNLRFGVVINRADAGDDRVTADCAAEGVPVLLEIPYDRKAAEAYSRGECLLDAVPGWRAAMRALFERVREDMTRSP